MARPVKIRSVMSSENYDRIFRKEQLAKEIKEEGDAQRAEDIKEDENRRLESLK